MADGRLPRSHSKTEQEGIREFAQVELHSTLHYPQDNYESGCLIFCTLERASTIFIHRRLS
jgi:hypothetical protein